MLKKVVIGVILLSFSCFSLLKSFFFKIIFMGHLAAVCVTEVSENSLNLRFCVFAPVNAAFPEPNKTARVTCLLTCLFNLLWQ